MRIAICEDNPDEMRDLLELIERFRVQHCLSIAVDTFHCAEDLLAIYQPRKYQILFMDIYMGQMTGMKAAALIREQDRDVCLILTTVSLEHGIEGFRVRATDYLLKPIDERMFSNAMERCGKVLREYARSITVKEGRSDVSVVLRDIQFVEVFGNYCILHTALRDVKSYIRLDEMERLLDGYPFLRCHRSFIVNLSYVRGLEEKEFLLSNGGKVLVGSAYRAKARQAYGAHMESLLF